MKRLAGALGGVVAGVLVLGVWACTPRTSAEAGPTSGKRGAEPTMSTGIEIASLATLFEERRLAFSPDGKWLAVSARSSGLSVYEAGSGRVVKHLAPSGAISRVGFDATGKRLFATLGSDLLVWTVPAWAPSPPDSWGSEHFLLHPTRPWVARANSTSEVEIREIGGYHFGPEGQLGVAHGGMLDDFADLAFDDDGRVVVGEPGQFRVYRLQPFAEVGSIPRGQLDTIRSLEIRKDVLLATTSRGATGALTALDWPSGAPRYTLPLPGGGVAMAVDRAGHWAAVAYVSSGTPQAPVGGVAVVDIAGRKVTRTIEAVPAPVSVALSPDGRQAAYAGSDGAPLHVVDLASSKALWNR
ncbi:WD40 repeat domain-containing protein [Sorangium sp. So ce542]|uniref:WD40 repeat domain-containing protein n=1 Tax=Sorangium sp. So ce542 TaxID=3133316 RepID=UPI003F632672